MDILWLNEDSVSDSDNLPSREVIAQNVVEDFDVALKQFRLVANDLGPAVGVGEES